MKWISIKDELPPFNTIILVYTKEDDLCLTMLIDGYYKPFWDSPAPLNGMNTYDEPLYWTYIEDIDKPVIEHSSTPVDKDEEK